MELYQYSIPNIIPFSLKNKKNYLLSLTKDSTYTMYRDHHRYILHHKITYEYVLSSYVYQTIVGKLYLTDDMGYKSPCTNIPILINTNNTKSCSDTYTDENGRYTSTCPLDTIHSINLKRSLKKNHDAFIHNLPLIKVIFPFNTIIADKEDNILVESWY